MPKQQYQVLADELRKKIESGEWPPGTKLPSRSQLCKEFGVSDTVVSAYLSRTPPGADPLTARERQVLQLVAEGMSTKEVAAFLNVSFKTAESHRTRIMSKLDIHGTAGLVRYAIRQGIIQP